MQHRRAELAVALDALPTEPAGRVPMRWPRRWSRRCATGSPRYPQTVRRRPAELASMTVNAVADGMNLVAKEAAVVNQSDAVLVLSENTGAHQELGDHAVTVYPYDICQQADALYEALTMPTEQRRANLRAAADVITRNDTAWFSAQLADRARDPA